MSKAKTKKTAAHLKAEQEVVELKALWQWITELNTGLHAKIEEERADFYKRIARMAVDRTALEATIIHLKKELTELIIASTK